MTFVPPEQTCPSEQDLADVCRTGAIAGNQPGADANEIRRLVEALYPELHRIARAHMRRERTDHTWQATALVSEAFIKLAGQPAFHWRDKSHFLFATSKVMRLLLIDHARQHNAAKYGGLWAKIPLEDVQPASPDNFLEYLEVHKLLTEMSAFDQRVAAVVELKVFGGLTHAEIGELLGFNERTIKRDWQFASAWLVRALKRGDDRGGMGEDQKSI